MKMLKSIISTLAFIATATTPAFASGGTYTPPKKENPVAQGLPFSQGNPPPISFAYVSTPYGMFGCKQRAQNKLFQIGATGINEGSGSAIAVYGYYGSTTIGVWCRGGEAIIMTAGDNSSSLRNEMRSAF